MIETVFSPDFFAQLRRFRPACWGSAAAESQLAVVDREAQELAVAAIFARIGESVIWLGGENEPLGAEREKLGQWLKLFGREDVPVHIHTLPFEDPYINTAPDPRAHRGQAAAAGRPARRARR